MLCGVLQHLFLSQVVFCISRPSFPCMLLGCRAAEIPLDVDKEKTIPEASSQRSPHLLYWALTYVQHIRLKSTKPLSVALPSQEGSRWRENGGGPGERSVIEGLYLMYL